MHRFTPRLVLSLLLLAALAHAPLVWSGSLFIQTLAVLVLTALIPGALVVELLIGQGEAPPSHGERTLYSLATGYGVMVLVMLGLSYLPGPITKGATFLAFDGLLLFLAALVWWRQRYRQGRLSVVASTEYHLSTYRPRVRQIILAVGLLVIFLIGGFFRLTNLGYSEFQGDEARAVLRAAAVIQGYEDVLLIHKKGPLEILIPTTIYALTGHLNEVTARLPFAIANLAALYAIFLLGWRLHNPLAGWCAAFLLAFDGYLIGFARIVQYQSVILLISVLSVSIFYRLWQQPKALRGYFALAAFLLATGLLAHYEAIVVAVPLLFLLGMFLWQRRVAYLTLVGALVPAAFVGGLMLAPFYIPFILSPHFAATYTYLTDRRIGGDHPFPFNNLADFFLRSTVYNTTYYVLLMIGLTVVALIVAYGRSFQRRWHLLLSIAVVSGLALTFWRTTWLQIGQTDWIVVLFAAAFLLVWGLPGLRVEERLLWLWFGAMFLLSIFFTAKPRTHVYIFFTPWALLVGVVLAQAWQWVRTQYGQISARVAGSLIAVTMTVLFGTYAYWYFVYNQVEILRTWSTSHPSGYWVPYDLPDNRAIFGFPLANGWKVVGALYQQGILQGDFDTNEKEAWVPAWYTRGERRCRRSAEWFFKIDNLEPFSEGEALNMNQFLDTEFTLWGKVEINGAERMAIYRQKDARGQATTTEPLHTFRLDDFKALFDDQVAQANLPLSYPIVESSLATMTGSPLHANLDQQIWLEGYEISNQAPLRPGDIIHLTLFWRAQKSIQNSYKVFTQAYYGNGTMVAQQDGYPVCETRKTNLWDPGELITDQYDIPVHADAPAGTFPLYTGLYLTDSGARLPVLDQAGQPMDDKVHLTDIQITKSANGSEEEN